MIEAVKGAAHGRARLKVILETAALGGAESIAAASREHVAGEYLALAERKLGPDWPGPGRFRIGASGLLREILNDLGAAESLPAGQA
jgi:deoxyribose-phosphate aldolase